MKSGHLRNIFNLFGLVHLTSLPSRRMPPQSTMVKSHISSRSFCGNNRHDMIASKDGLEYHNLILKSFQIVDIAKSLYLDKSFNKEVIQ